MKGAQRTAEVYVDAAEESAPILMGALHVQGSGNGEILSFEYHPGWLERPEAFEFDPDLQLVSGPQYPAQTRNTSVYFSIQFLTAGGECSCNAVRTSAQGKRSAGRAG